MTNKKSIVKNFIYNTLFTVLNILFPLITLPYASRIIGVTGIGKVNFANSIVNYFLMVASLGIPLYGIREIAKVRDNKEKLNKTFTEIFTINLMATVFCIIVYYFMIFNVDAFQSDFTLYLICGISLFLNVFNLDWFFKGLEEYKYITVRSIIIKCISLAVLFLIVKTKEDYILYALVNVIAISGNNFINFTKVIKLVKIQFKGIDLKKRIKPIMVLLSVQVAVNIYINLDTTMCGILAGTASVAYYSNAIKISKIISSVVISISTILLPTLSYYIENDEHDRFNEVINQALNIILFVGIPSMVGVYFVSTQIVIILFGSEFLPSIATLKILSALTVILAVGNLFGTQVLMSIGQEKKLLISVIAGAVINFSLNYLLIPIYQHNGAAMATVIGEGMVMIIQTYYACKYIKVEIKFNYIAKLFISTTFMVIALMFTQSLIKSTLVSLVVSVAVGVIIYVGSNLVLKNQLLFFMMEKLRKKA